MRMRCSHLSALAGAGIHSCVDLWLPKWIFETRDNNNCQFLSVLERMVTCSECVCDALISQPWRGLAFILVSTFGCRNGFLRLVITIIVNSYQYLNAWSRVVNAYAMLSSLSLGGGWHSFLCRPLVAEMDF